MFKNNFGSFYSRLRSHTHQKLHLENWVAARIGRETLFAHHILLKLQVRARATIARNLKHYSVR